MAVEKLLEATLEPRGGLQADGYRGRARRKKGHFIQQIDFAEIWRKVGIWTRRFRRWDKETDSYDEVVVDDAGQVVHECHERLSEHSGHGSAKRRD